MARHVVGCCAVAVVVLASCGARLAADEPKIVGPVTGSANDAVVRRIDDLLAARLKQLRAFWPPHRFPDRPIRVELHGTLDAYRAAVAKRGAPIDNPACYFADEATIVLGFDGRRFDDPLRHHQQRTTRLREDLKSAEKRLIAQLRDDEARFQRDGTPRDERKRLTSERRRAFQVSAARMQAEIDQAEAENRRTLDEATARLSAAAAHELFHAYVEACITSPDGPGLPVWLNEGLAQIIERTAPTATLGTATRADAAQLARWKEARKRGEAVVPRDVLSADAAKYLVHAAQPPRESADYYLAAWAVTQALLNADKLEAGAALNRFLDDRGADPIKRFEELVDAPLGEWEKSAWK